MEEKVVITLTVQDIDYLITVRVPVLRKGIDATELERRARNIFNTFSIKKAELQKEKVTGKVSLDEMREIYDELGMDFHKIPPFLSASINRLVVLLVKERKK